MTNLKMRTLMSASALILAAGAGAAHAETIVYGGGSTLSAPYVRQAEDCYGVRASLYTPGKPSTNPPPEVYTTVTAGVSTTTDCSVTQQDPNVKMYLEASGSGAGIQSFYTHNAANLGTYTDESGTSGVTFPAMHYATSDTTLSAADVVAYNTGAPAVEGKTVNVSSYGANDRANPNPLYTYGRLVQVPLLIAPVTFAYSPVYKKVTQSDGLTVKSYSFKITNPKAQLVNGSPVLQLDLLTYCKIFNGEITNWNDPAIAALNGLATKHAATKATPAYTTYTPIVDPNDPDAATWSTTGLPIELVARSDGSGTTSIVTRALSVQCNGLPGVTNRFPDFSSTMPTTTLGTGAAANGAAFTATPGSGLFSGASGSGGVASYLKFSATPMATPGAEVVSGKLGYLSPDYVAPVTPAHGTDYGLVPAALQVYASRTGTAKYVLPTAKAALASYGTPVAPSCMPSSTVTCAAGTDMTDASNWVETPHNTAPVATPTSTSGYPIVGTTQILTYTCYKDTAKNSDANIGYKLNRFLYFYLKNPIVTATTGILATYGFSPLPAAFRTAEYNAFVNPGSAKVATNTLFVSPKSDLIQASGTKVSVVWPHNTACDAANIVGG